MKERTTKPALIPNLICSFFGHNFEVSRKVTKHVKEYECCHCKKQLTTDSNGHLRELTPTYKEINSILERIYTRRKMRLEQKTFMSAAS